MTDLSSETVDPDEAVVDEIYEEWLGNEEGVRGAIVAAIKRGRALERDAAARSHGGM